MIYDIGALLPSPRRRGFSYRWAMGDAGGQRSPNDE